MSPDPDNISGFLYPDDPQSWNGYAYARNNPLTYTDPDGELYKVCDENGKNCSEQSDKQFDQNKKDAQQNGEVWKNGKIYMPDGNGGLQQKGTYVQTDVDIPGDPDANRNAAAMIGNGEAFVKEFMYRSVRDGVTGGVLGYAAGEFVGGVAEGLGIFKNTKTVINWTHNIMSVRPGIPPPGSAAEVTAAVEGAIQTGNYTMKGGGLIEGTTTIQGVTVGFRGRIVDGVARIATVFTKR